MKSISGVLFGIMLFLVSFGVLYWNEGRADLSDVAKKAVIIQADSVTSNTELDGQLVSASGTVTAEPLIGDDLYLKPGSYFAVERHVDVYAWVEQSETVTRNPSDGPETTETVYSYVMEWVDEPADAKEFHEPEGHTNPAGTLDESNTTVSSAMVEQYGFTPEVIDLPVLSPVTLKADKVSLTQNATLVSEAYIYVRNSTTGTYQAPQLGDERVSYAVLPVPFEGTVFGKLDGSTIDPFVTKKGDTFYRVFNETHDESVARLHAEYTTALWAFRVFGFLMMWFGLALLFTPIRSVLDFVPILGGIGKAVIAFITFVVALILSAVTVVVSAVLHNLIAVIIVVAVMLGLAMTAGAVAKKNKIAHHPEISTK
ncbi:MAG: TMEM43 family protein [Patescibacteria group bacterium]